MFSKVYSATIAGVEAIPVQVEADVSNGLPGFVMIGFLSSHIKESQDRVRSSLRNAGINLPPKKITINMSPADVRKKGSRFDLPVATAVLAATGLVPMERTNGLMIAGELSLDGKVNPVNGILATVLKAREMGLFGCMIPYGNLKEAVMIDDIEIIAVSEIAEVIDFLRHGKKKEYGKAGIEVKEDKEAKDDKAAKDDKEAKDDNDSSEVDFLDIHGQTNAKRAALIAAAGFHNMLMTGPPGSGKSMIAGRLPGILPALTKEESLELTGIYSIAGRLGDGGSIVSKRPFRAPHHTITEKALIGGGTVPGPGEITMAHKGVLFLDEMPEFPRSVLELLRVPLEEKKITVSRSFGTFDFPADFLLVAARNPCPCGYYPDLNRCRCTAGEIIRYNEKISHPLLDRIDLNVYVGEMTYQEASRATGQGMSTADMRRLVEKAYDIQRERFGGLLKFNSSMTSAQVKKYCALKPDAERLMEQAYRKMGMSVRGYHRVLKVARTVADLDESEYIEERHLAEAIAFRNSDLK